MAGVLADYGFADAEAVAASDLESLCQVPGIGQASGAKILASANEVAQIDKLHVAAVATKKGKKASGKKASAKPKKAKGKKKGKKDKKAKKPGKKKKASSRSKKGKGSKGKKKKSKKK